MNEFEHIRESLRDLMKYLPHSGAIYNTNFTDDILSVEWKEAELENDDLRNYKAKAEFYLRQHQDNAAVAKLRSNIPLTGQDVAELEKFFGAKWERDRTMKLSAARNPWVSLCAKLWAWT